MFPAYAHVPNSWKGEKPPFAPGVSWGQALYRPHPSQVYFEDGAFRVIYDGFPKSRIHLLIVPVQPRAHHHGMQSLSKADIPFLESMLGLARRLVGFFESPEFAGLEGVNAQVKASAQAGFRVGFHAIPSMRPIHLHVISADFDSPCLKTGNHFNSFATAFLVHPQIIIEMLRAGDSLINYATVVEGLVHGNKEFECFRCGEPFRELKIAREHLRKCRRPTQNIEHVSSIHPAPPPTSALDRL
eukprot:ANDGO_02838.mRNA.1 Aprataxin